MSSLHKARDIQAGAVAAGHRVTADAAARILDQGGNAFEAAACGLIAACLAEPVFASPGGGGFMCARNRYGQTENLDFFVDLPGHKNDNGHIEEIHVDFGTTQQCFFIGAGSSAVPGMGPGIQALIRHGSGAISLSQLFATALGAARDLRISAMQATLFSIVEPILMASHESRALFAPEGKLLGESDPFDNPDLVALFQKCVSGDFDPQNGLFDNGALLKQQRQNDGHLLAPDLQDYEIVNRKPVHWGNADCRIISNAPPAMGGLLSLAMLSQFTKSAHGIHDRVRAVSTVDRYWRMNDDPQAIAAEFGIDMQGPPITHSHNSFNGTTHISVIDRRGNAVAVTVSCGASNGQIVPECGYLMNNMLGEEDVNPAGADNWQVKPLGQRRLASMMAPTIAQTFDDSLIALGSGGSNRIRTALYQVLANRLITGMALAEAIAQPRIHGERNTLDIEDVGNQADVKALEGVFDKTNLWNEQSLYFGGVHGVERMPNGRFTGAGDPRREGAFVVVD